MDYLRQQKISIHRLALEHADIYAYKNKDGIANWDITVPDTVQSASSPAGDAMNISELDIRQISIQHATVTMDDRDTRIFANLWDTNLTLKANMKKGHSMLAVDFRNKNLLFWQDGLHTPSLETVLHMIPESILKKAGKLTNEEYEIMKSHVEKSIEMIHYLPNMNYVIPAVVSHHERYDGKGYPRGIKGEEIPFLGRILAVCDSFDAMISKRAYKEPLSVEYAMGELEKNKGTQFDPEVADAFIELIKEGKVPL